MAKLVQVTFVDFWRSASCEKGNIEQNCSFISFVSSILCSLDSSVDTFGSGLTFIGQISCC
jgi:hypothetical protein